MKPATPLPIVLFLAACAAGLTGCSDAKPPASSLRVVPMTIGHKTFQLEIANTEDSREYGLMKRDSMPVDHGMIFVFPEEESRDFWMKNTRIPLDILFLRGDGQVISISQMKPYDTSTTPSGGPAKYAIELNQGAANEAGVKVGDRLDIPREASEAKN